MTKDKVDRRRVVTEERREFMRKIRVMGLEKRRANREAKLREKLELKQSRVQEDRLLKKLDDVMRLLSEYKENNASPQLLRDHYSDPENAKKDASISGIQGLIETITTPQNSSPPDNLEYS